LSLDKPQLVLVGGEVVGWNSLLPSLITLAEKLEELGVVYHDGTTSYIEIASKVCSWKSLFYN
jgi:hypothetical protein